MEIYTANNIKEIIKGISGIYRITNIVNGRTYYGQASCFKQRWKIHIKDLNGGYHDNDYFQNDFNKCGANIGNLTFEIMEICPNIKGILDSIEQTYLDMFWDSKKQCYNISKNAGAFFKGMKHTAASKKQMSVSQSGKKRSPQARANISKGLKGKKGKQIIEKCINVYQYDSDGNFVKKYIALSEAGRDIISTIRLGKQVKDIAYCISKTSKQNIELNKNNKTYMAYGFVWLLNYMGEKINVIKKKIYTIEECKAVSNKSKATHSTENTKKKLKYNAINRNPNAKKIKQYDLNGSLIKIWDCIKFARDAYSINEKIMYDCYKQKIKSAGGYVWRFINDDF